MSDTTRTDAAAPTQLEVKLRLSVVWLSLNTLAKELEAVDSKTARIIAYAARVLALAK